MAGKTSAIKLSFDQLGGIMGVPPEFLAAMDLHEEVTPGVDNTVGPDAIASTTTNGKELFFSRVETPRINEREKHNYYKKPGNIVLLGANTNDEGQPVQVTRTLFRTGTGTPTVPSATTKVATTNLGNGWSIQEASVEGTYDNSEPPVFTPSVFPARVYDVALTDSLPLKFRDILPIITTTVTAAGQASLPTLSLGELERKDEQTDEFTHRLTIAGRDISLLPLTLHSRLTNQDRQEVDLSETLQLTTDSVPDPTAYVEVNTENLGNGTTLVSVQTVSSYALKYGQTFDTESGLPKSYSEQIFPKADAADYLGVANVEVTPIDELRDRVRIMLGTSTGYSTFLRLSVGRTQLYFPERLVSLQYTLNSGIGAGANSESGTGSASGTSGSVAIFASNSCEFNVAAMPEITPVFASKPLPTQDVSEYYFILPTNSTKAALLTALATLTELTITAWPKFNEQEHVISMLGGSSSMQLSAQARVSVSFSADSASGASSSGGGQSLKHERTNRALIIKPSIHGTLVVQPTGAGVGYAATATQTISASESLGGYSPSHTETGSVSIQTVVYPISLASTGGATAFPTSGLYLYDYKVSNQELVPGQVAVRATVFNFADLV